MKQSHGNGFTLIEMVTVMAIIGILAAFAVPSYNNHLQTSRRTDAMTALLMVQSNQTMWRANNVSYTANLTGDLGWSSSDTPDGFYTLSLSNISATTYTVTATPKTGTTQESDSCGVFVLNQEGPDISTSNKKLCWKKS